jgi:hypothetical protein
VDRYFGITPRRFNQILEVDDEPGAKADPRPRSSGSGTSEDDLRENLNALDEEVARLRAQLDDPVKLCVARWQEREPEDVQAELNRIIGDLNLGDCLKVELLDVY